MKENTLYNTNLLDVADLWLQRQGIIFDNEGQYLLKLIDTAEVIRKKLDIRIAKAKIAQRKKRLKNGRFVAKDMV